MQLVVLNKIQRNKSTMIFKCLNTIDNRRLDVSIVDRPPIADIRAIKSIRHNSILKGDIFEASNNKIIQVTKSSLYDMSHLSSPQRLILTEQDIRSLLFYQLSAIRYCLTLPIKNLEISPKEIVVVRETAKPRYYKWAFKLKNCIIENQNCNYNDIETLLKIGKERKYPKDESWCVCSLMNLGSIAFKAIYDPHGYKDLRQYLSDSRYSQSVIYIVNALLNYRTIKNPPSISELLLYLQTPNELYNERLRASLYRNTNIRCKSIGKFHLRRERCKSCLI